MNYNAFEILDILALLAFLPPIISSFFAPKKGAPSPPSPISKYATELGLKGKLFCERSFTFQRVPLPIRDIKD